MTGNGRKPAIRLRQSYFTDEALVMEGERCREL